MNKHIQSADDLEAAMKNVGPYGPAYLRRGTIREAMQVLAAFEGMVKLMNEAAKKADLLDTLVREYIPAKVWDFLQSEAWKQGDEAWKRQNATS